MSTSPGPNLLIERDEFRRMEAAAPRGVRLERMDGYVYAMAGAGLAHERIVARVLAALSAPARRHGCEVFGSNRRLSMGDQSDFLPDVSVYCDESDNDEYAGFRPCLIVEVLSRSTAIDDLNLKVPRYKALPSVETIVLINPEPLYVEMFARTGEIWKHSHHTAVSDSITLTCPPCDLFLADLAP